MTLEITVATLVALGYALGAYADEKRARESLGRRQPDCAMEDARARSACRASGSDILPNAS